MKSPEQIAEEIIEINELDELCRNHDGCGNNGSKAAEVVLAYLQKKQGEVGLAIEVERNESERLRRLFDEMEKEMRFLSVSAPPLYEDKDIRWLWYDAIDRFRTTLLKRVSAIISDPKPLSGKVK